MKKVLVTGITGFAGSFLAEELLQKNEFEVYGTYLNESSLENVAAIKDKLNLNKLDLLDYDSVVEKIAEISPDYIFHLAGIASAKDSFENPSKVFVNNVNSQINLLEAVRINKLTDSKILIISSGEVYGLVDEENLPINEDAPLRPTNTYAVSKLSQDFLGLQYFLTYGLKIIRVRPFNHIGPRQAPNFVVSSFAKKIAEVEKSNSNTIKVGNLESKRDFTDVRDMVKAYIMAIEKGEEGEVYNIGSGKSYSISEILEKLIKLSGKEIKLESDENLFRPLDNPETVADTAKFIKLTGWKTEINIDTTLQNTLDYWRGAV